MGERVNVTVSDNADRGRFEAVDESGVVAGFAEYRHEGDVLVFTHTEVDPAFEGRGVGSALAKGALDQAREAGRSVRPRCEFIAAYIDRHDEYGDLVAR